jgi:hypothetical protein
MRVHLRGNQSIAAGQCQIEESITDLVLEREQRQYSTRASSQNVQVAVGIDARVIERLRDARRRVDERVITQQLPDPEESID